MRPYISVGRGGPRVGVVLGARAVLGMGKFFVGFAAVLGAMSALVYGSSLNPTAQYAIVIAGVAIMFWLARRPYAPPMTAAEQEAAYQAAKAEFHGR
jgi:hypothetical protein